MLPFAYRVNVSAAFPTQVVGKEGVEVSRANGVYSIGSAYESLAPLGSIPTLAQKMVKVWDNVTGIYNTMPLSTLSIGGYNGGAWTLFTCTATPQSGTITTQSSTSSYTQIGKIVFLQITVSIPNVGSAVAPLAFSLPVLSKSANFALLGREGAISSKLLAGVPVSTSSFVAVVYDGTLSPAASGAVYQFSGTYEAQ